MKRMMLSIVIVNWNTRELLRQCLESVQAETQTRHEIFVVDNASSDGSVEMVMREFPDVHLVMNEENRGFAAANNQALVKGTGYYSLLLNSDTIVKDAALDKMVNYLNMHLEAGALGCRLLNVDLSLQASAHNFYSTWGSLIENRLVEALWRGRSSRTPFLTFWDHSRTRKVPWVTGACLMVRRSVMDAIGLLDEGFFMYGEEVDWQYRMHRAGFEVHFLCEAHIVHLGGASASLAPEATRKLETASRNRLIDKNCGALTRLIFHAKSALARGVWLGLSIVAKRGGGSVKAPPKWP